ncbi:MULTISPECIES: PfkB family carbohydrate kinase [unclassified Devosia]|jgi:sulfofructose kinase|uniref:PfkB family carbohydrate kinase n=1 Tax=unclassified Devosia TaxID=196773 RepID=UPI000963E351|nr:MULTISPECIES: PfkB family carbohydrate kinase [unclassified Devosia]MBN9365071.1 sugar kinase [Devosia sp.]OJX21091.1 MAG: ribokinase [Devosia sp. 66-14]
MGRILCVGALTMDTIFRLDRLPEGPGKVIPLDAVEVAEGMAAAQAASIVRLGGKAALWASAGDDATGDRLVQQISGEGVDCSRVRRVAGSRSGFSSIFMDRTGSTMIVPRYDPTLMAAPDAAPDLDGIDAVMTDVRWPGAAALALAAAKAAGIPAILDADMAAREVLDGLLPLASHVVASESAAKLVTGAETAEQAAGWLAVAHAGFVAVTAGADGCWWKEGGGIRHSPAPRIEAIDTLAAGDVFHAGFAVGLLEGWPMRNVIAFASAAAAIKCTRFGGRLGAPSRTEVEAFLVR